MLRFATHYRLLGLMTALPTTAKFMDFFQVYLLKNDFIREKSMETRDYVVCMVPVTTSTASPGSAV